MMSTKKSPPPVKSQPPVNSPPPVVPNEVKKVSGEAIAASLKDPKQKYVLSINYPHFLQAAYIMTEDRKLQVSQMAKMAVTSEMAGSTIKKTFKTLVVQLEKDALRIIKKVFPAKMFILNDLFVNHPIFNIVDVSTILQVIESNSDARNRMIQKLKSNPDSDNFDNKEEDDPSARIRRERPIGLVTSASKMASTANGSSIPVQQRQKIIYCDLPKIPSNRLILVIFDFLKAEVLELVSLFSIIKLWIQLNTPQIEDGNNFGVGVQQESLGEIARAEDQAFAMLDTIATYHATRAKLVSEVLKYPRIQDYSLCVSALDEKMYQSLRLTIADLRDNFAVLHDLFMKNLDKIKKPKKQRVDLIYS